MRLRKGQLIFKTIEPSWRCWRVVAINPRNCEIEVEMVAAGPGLAHITAGFRMRMPGEWVNYNVAGFLP